MNLTLIRDYSDREVTLGQLTAGSLTLQTLELPWNAWPPHACGHPDTSCVPAGEYQLVLHNTVSHPKTWALVNPVLGIYHEPGDIPDGEGARCAVLIHPGNTVKDSLACILVGRQRRLVAETWMITESRDAMEALQAMVPWFEQTLTIEYAPGISP